MRPYLAILSARFRTLLQYRAAAAGGVACQFFFGAVRMMIFTTFYESSAGVHPMTQAQTVAYIWLGQAMLYLLPFRADHELDAMIRSGSVVYELLRPVDLYNLWFARTLANRVAPMLLRAGPILIVATLTGWIVWPGPAALAAFAAAVTAAAMLTTSVTMLMNTGMFWTLAGRGLSIMAGGMLWVLSGMTIPLPLMPDWLQPVLNALPTRGLMDIPFRLFNGSLPPTAVWRLLAHQLGWCLALIMIGRGLMARAKRRLVIQGG